MKRDKLRGEINDTIALLTKAKAAGLADVAFALERAIEMLIAQLVVSQKSAWSPPSPKTDLMAELQKGNTPPPSPPIIDRPALRAPPPPARRWDWGACARRTIWAVIFLAWGGQRLLVQRQYDGWALAAVVMGVPYIVWALAALFGRV